VPVPTERSSDTAPRPAAAGQESPLRAHRRAAGLTQRQLAERSGVALGTVRDLEQGRTRQARAVSLDRIAAVLGVDAARLREVAPDAGRHSTDEPDAAIARPAAHAVAPSDVSVERRARGGLRDEVRQQGLWLRVLGPLAAWRDGVPIDLGAPKRRALLGLLAAKPNTPVRRATLVDALWPQSPPETASDLVSGYLNRLRRALDPGRSARDPGGLLVQVGGAYRLSVAGDELDLLTLRGLVEQARAAAERGADAAAFALYDRALTLWAGDPLGDVAALREHPAVLDLGRLYASLVLEFADVAARVGRQAAALPRLRALTADDPLNEAAHARLISALGATGQRAAALAVFDATRLRLAAELSIEPGRALLAAREQVLRDDCAPTPKRGDDDAPTPGSVDVRLPDEAAPPAWPVPRQLPATVPYLAGRRAELAALDGLLSSGAPSLAVIGGTAGVGKTTLALHWSHRHAQRFPDGQLYVNLRGFDPSGDPLPPAEALRGFLDAFGVPAHQVPREVSARAALFRSLLADRRVLVLLDNARDAAQVRPLLPGTPHAVTLVTSRNELTGLVASDGARAVPLGVLSDAEARELLDAQFGAARTAVDEPATAELAALCAHLPLALAVVGARAASRGGGSLGALVAELRDAHGRLDALDIGDAATDVRAAFSWSYRRLSSGAARLFRCVGLHPSPEFSVTTAASLASVSTHRALRELAELTRARLLTDQPAGRFVPHDLLRLYAAERACAVDPPEERRAAVRRLLDHYLYTADAAASLLVPARASLRPAAPPAVGVTLDQLSDAGQALRWFEAEHEALLAAVTLAADQGFDEHAWRLAVTLGAHLDRRGHWAERVTMLGVGLAAAERLGDLPARARILRHLGATALLRHDAEAARTRYQQAFALYQHLDDRLGQAHSQRGLAEAAEQRGEMDSAIAHSWRALGLYAAVGDLDGQAHALNDIAWDHARKGEHEQAVEFCQRALPLHRAVGDRAGEASTWDSLGFAYLCAGRHELAVDCYRRAVAITDEIGDRHRAAKHLANLGDAQQAAGDTAGAVASWRRALRLCTALRLPAADEIRERLARGAG
jgi:DNA-binding SARP family transcriptional activator/DNA-binding XRE family transcriptional regulator